MKQKTGTKELIRIITAISILFMLIPLSIAANDPGHDTLYIEETGNSELDGNLNITKNLSIEGGQTYQGGGLTIYGDDTTPTPGGVFISGTSSNHLYFDGQGNIYIKYLSGGDTVYIGKAGITATDVNISGALYVQSSTLTVNGQNVCLADGTNCPSSLGGANVTSVGSSTDNAIARWHGAGADTIQNSGITIDDSNNIAGAATIEASSDINTTGGDICIEGGNCLSSAGTGSGNISGSGADNRVAFWTGSDTISYNDNLTWNRSAYRLGIGTDNPTYSLHIQEGDLLLQDPNGDQRIILKETASWNDYTIRLESDGDLSFLNDNEGTEVLHLQQGGYIGINTTKPNTTLHVDGSINATGDICEETSGNCLSSAGSGDGDITDVLTSTDAYLYNGSDTGKVVLRFNETKLNATITAKDTDTTIGNCSGDGSCSNILYTSTSFSGNVTGTYDATVVQDVDCTDCLGLTQIEDIYLLDTGDTATGNYTFGSTALHIDDTNDRVGIGTSSPSEKLDVNGSTRLSDSLSSEVLYDPIDDGLVLHMSFPEGTGSTTTDRSKSGHTGMISGSSWVEGKLGYGLNLRGAASASASNDYVSIADTTDSSLDITDAITMEAWFKTIMATADDSYIITKDNGWLTNHTFGLALWDDQIYVVLNNTANSIANTDYQDGNWHHITITWNGSLITYYMDGKSLGTDSFTGTLFTNNRNVTIGARTKGKSYGFNGTIDEVRLYNRALSANEVRNRYERGVGTLAPYVDFNGKVGIGTAAPNATLYINSSGSEDILRVEDAGIIKLYMDADGKIGIFNSNPQEDVHIGSGTDANGYSLLESAQTLHVTGDGTTVLSVRNSNNNIEGDIVASNDRVRFGTSTNHNLTLMTNNADIVTITNDGRVGIGSGSPSADAGNLGSNMELYGESGNVTLLIHLDTGGTNNGTEIHMRKGALDFKIRFEGSSLYFDYEGDTKMELDGSTDTLDVNGKVCGNRFFSWLYQGYDASDTGDEMASTWTSQESEGKTYSCMSCRTATDNSTLACNSDSGAWAWCEFNVTC